MKQSGAAASPSVAPSLDDCLAQLKRIIESPKFDATARERRFLQYIVEETSAGHHARIKAYTIATAVFGRDSSFDAQNDPIVRIAAGHLRRSLERYYLTDGANDTIVIAVPKGGYVPTFSVRTQSDATIIEPMPASATDVSPISQPASRHRRVFVLFAAATAFAAMTAYFALPDRDVPSLSETGAHQSAHLLVEPFDNLGGSLTSGDIAIAVTHEIIGQLSRFRDIVVLDGSRPSSDPSAVTARYALRGSAWLTPETFRFRVRLINRSDGAVLWADTYSGSMTVPDVVQAQTVIADSVATNLAQVYGVIFQADAGRSLSLPPEDWDAYACTLSFHAYRASMDQVAAKSVLDCLERAVAEHPDYSSAWALLALTQLDELRGRFPYDPVEFRRDIDRILGYARRAVSIDPQNVRALEAEMFALFFDDQPVEGRRVGERALALNPNDMALLGEYGSRLALSGEWGEGCLLMRKARDGNPITVVNFETGLALCAYFEGNLDEAASLIANAGPSSHPLYHLIAAAISGEAGDAVGAENARLWMEQNAPMLLENVRQEVSHRLARPEDVDRALASLAKAGLTIPDGAPDP